MEPKKIKDCATRAETEMSINWQCSAMKKAYGESAGKHYGERIWREMFAGEHGPAAQQITESCRLEWRDGAWHICQHRYGSWAGDSRPRTVVDPCAEAKDNYVTWFFRQSGKVVPDYHYHK